MGVPQQGSCFESIFKYKLFCSFETSSTRRGNFYVEDRMMRGTDAYMDANSLFG